MASMIKTHQISVLICSLLVEVGCKVLSGDEILRLERVWVRSEVCGGEEGQACELWPWSYNGEREFEIRERFHPWRERERERERDCFKI